MEIRTFPLINAMISLFKNHKNKLFYAFSDNYLFNVVSFWGKNSKPKRLGRYVVPIVCEHKYHHLIKKLM